MRLSVKVTPKGGRDEVLGFENGVLKVKVSAPPEEGRANKALLELLSKFFGVSKSSVSLAKGERSRSKLVDIQGDSALLERKLNSHV